MQTEALTQGQADEIAVAQLMVFSIVVRHTANTADDAAVQFLLDSPNARAWFFDWLGLDADTQQLLDLSGLPFLGDLAKYGATFTQLLEVLNQLKQYAPQILAAVQVIKSLLDAFKGSVPSVPSAPGVGPIVPPKF